MAEEEEGRTPHSSDGKKVEVSKVLFWRSWRHRWLPSPPAASSIRVAGSSGKPCGQPPELGSPGPTSKRTLHNDVLHVTFPERQANNS